LYQSLDAKAVLRHVDCVEDQDSLRRQVTEAGLVAFVGDGSILPRASGNSDAPMDAQQAIKFQSPPSLQRQFALPHRGTVTGMAIPQGITLIVGGGFHGKSTLLQALQLGVYNVIPGDGRELVVTDASAVTIRAEDGRSVESVDISPFINNLPFGKQTTDFSTPDASGSTSQAANILEALEMGAKTMLIDEDTAATNFMVRDKRMMQLVASHKEPITPYIAKVRQLSRDGVSSIMVIGGCGDYFDVADLVIMQENYAASDVTQQASLLKQPLPDEGSFGKLAKRAPQSDTINAAREGDRPGHEKVAINGKHMIRFGDLEIGLESVHQLADKSQTRAIGDALILARDSYMDGRTPLSEVLDKLERRFDEQGLDALMPGRFIGNYARPRRYEMGMAINRLRSIKFKQVRG